MLIQTDTEAIRKAANDIIRSSNSIEDAINVLSGQIASLQSSWKGNAAIGFEGVYQEWRSVTPKMINALNDLELAAKKIAGNYDATEEANTLKGR
jgi:early secretory antigenic target protein ESAT-6